MPRLLPAVTAAALALSLAQPAAAQTRAAPEIATGFAPRAPVTANRFMAVTANPHASSAAVAMLKAGGSAVDAAIAAQMVLNLVEPQSSGIGGGGFLLHWDAAAGRLDSYDGRETAPAAATPDRFLRDGKPMKFREAVPGGLSVGVPGLLRMLEMAHQRHGQLPWADLFAPAIALARDGFAVSPRLSRLIASDPFLPRFAASRAYFLDAAGEPLKAGVTLRNPAFAETLTRIAREGADALHTGPIAAAIVAAVRGASVNPGDITPADLAGYRAVRRDPVCIGYRAYQVCGMPPPTSGGVAVLQMLKLLEPFDIGGLDPLSADWAHLISEAGRLAFADRNLYLADPDFVRVPVEGLLDVGYLLRRAATIDVGSAIGKAQPGDPPDKAGLDWAPGQAADLPSTTHLSIVDGAGNVVSMTSSIESQFGSGLFVRGFLLNNELTDFSFRPVRDGRTVANRVEPGKRPRSSMAPILVLRGGSPALAIGSPGGSRIIGYVARATMAILDNGLDPQAAVSLPHVVNRNGATDLEQDTAAVRMKPGLEALGHEVRLRAMTSGLHAIAIAPDGTLTGGADPRREGAAMGE